MTATMRQEGERNLLRDKPESMLRFSSFLKFFNCFSCILFASNFIAHYLTTERQEIKRLLAWHDTKYNCRAYASQGYFFTLASA